jgi:hypothetical protein
MHNEAVKCYQYALLYLDKITCFEEFKKDIAEILPKLLHAYSDSLIEIGEVLYEDENFDAAKFYDKQTFFFTRIM